MRSYRTFLLALFFSLFFFSQIALANGYGVISQIPSQWNLAGTFIPVASRGSATVAGVGTFHWGATTELHSLYSTFLNQQKLYIGVGENPSTSPGAFSTVLFDDLLNEIGEVETVDGTLYYLFDAGGNRGKALTTAEKYGFEIINGFLYSNSVYGDVPGIPISLSKVKSSSCSQDQYIPLAYPDELFVASLERFLKIHDGDKSKLTAEYDQSIINQNYPSSITRDKVYPIRPSEAPENRGYIWIPKEACGQSVDLLIAFHGWRSLKYPTDSVYLNIPGQKTKQKEFDAIIRSAVNAKTSVPIVVAAPMDDRGPHEEVFQQNFDINEYVSKINSILNSKGITIKQVSLLGYSNANCGGGLATSAMKLKNYPLYLYASADGTCGSTNFFQTINHRSFENLGQTETIDLLTSLKQKNTIVFHMHQNDVGVAKAIKDAGAGGQDKVVQFPEKFVDTWASNDGLLFTYKVSPQLDQSDKIHGRIPGDLLKELLPRFFSPMGAAVSASSCGYSKIAVMGASNDVEISGSSSYASYIRSSCASSTVTVHAVDGYSIQEQESKLLTNALATKPDVLIVNPSGNTCSKGKDAEEGIDSVLSVIQKARNEDVKKVVILTISPRGDVAYNDCITKFNAGLKSRSVDGSVIKIVDIYLTLVDPAKPNFCKSEYCNSGGLHWSDAGDKVVASQILNEVFGVQLVVKSGVGTSGGSSSGGGIQVGTTAAVQQISQNCQIEQRCKDIDSAWITFGSLLGIHAGEVWVPPKNTWKTFAGVYSPKPISSAAGVANTFSSTSASSTGLSGAGVVECGTEDPSMVPEQKAILDTIAVMEATTSFGIKHNVPSYNIMVGGNSFKDLSKHPRLTGEMTQAHVDAHDSTAAGRYQFLSCHKNCENFFPNGFSPVEQDKEAWKRIVDKRGVSLDLLKSASSNLGAWATIGNKFALEWSSVQYTLPISSDNKWHVDNQNYLLKKGITLDQVPQKCGNGRSYYCQGAGYSHEKLAQIYNICLKHYQNSGQKGARFYIKDGKAVSSSSSSAAPQSTPTG